MRKSVESYNVNAGGVCAIWKEEDGLFSWEVTYPEIPGRPPKTSEKRYDTHQEAREAAPHEVVKPTTFGSGNLNK